jgi:urease accessory protein
MDDTYSFNLASQQQAPLNSNLGHWKASLALVFGTQGTRTFLARKQHCGPLVIQKTLHPEGNKVCHGIIIHPPGGVAGGDELTLEVTLTKNANALLTTPGAGKWYKANSKVASQDLQFYLAENACLEWLPQENILFDGAMVDFSANIILAENAKYIAWEILCLGRQARGERWKTGRLCQNLTIKRKDKVIWQERAMLMANDRFFDSLIGLGGNVVSGSFVIAAGNLPTNLLAECQQVQLADKTDDKARFGVTVLPEVFSARYIGMSAPAAREYFERLWHILRPWYLSRSAARPRIWNT